MIPSTIVPLLYGVQPIHAIKSMLKIVGYAREAIRLRKDALASILSKKETNGATSVVDGQQGRPEADGRGEGADELNGSSNSVDDAYPLLADGKTLKPKNVIDFYLLAAAGLCNNGPSSQAFDYGTFFSSNTHTPSIFQSLKILKIKIIKNSQLSIMAILRVTNMFFFFSNCLTENK
jgi:hypothetical protein